MLARLPSHGTICAARAFEAGRSRAGTPAPTRHVACAASVLALHVAVLYLIVAPPWQSRSPPMAVSSTVVVLLPQQARPVDDPPPVAQPVLPLPQQAVLASPNIVVLPIAIRAAAAPLTAKAEATPARQATPAVAAPPHAATPPVATPAWQAELLRCLARARRYPARRQARAGRRHRLCRIHPRPKRPRAARAVGDRQWLRVPRRRGGCADLSRGSAAAAAGLSPGGRYG